MRVDIRTDSMSLLEDHEAIQLSIMNVVDGLVKGTLEPQRARLIIQALRIATRNAKYARFDACYYRRNEQKMVREVPNYAHQYLIEHPEFGPPISPGAGAPAREADQEAPTTNHPADPAVATQATSSEATTAKQELVSTQTPAAERRN